MKKTALSIATAALLVGGSLMTASCGLGTAGQALASQALTNYLTTGHVTGGGNLAAAALQTIFKDQDTANALGTIASSLIQGFMQHGTPFAYTGGATTEALSGTYEPMAYNTIGKGTPHLDVTLTANQRTIGQATTAALTLPAYTVADGITASEMTIANLGLTTAGSVTNIALTDNSGFSGTPTLTVKGTHYPATTVYITEAKVVGQQLTLNMTIYYGKDYTNPVNLTYTGTVK